MTLPKTTLVVCTRCGADNCRYEQREGTRKGPASGHLYRWWRESIRCRKCKKIELGNSPRKALRKWNKQNAN